MFSSISRRHLAAFGAAATGCATGSLTLNESTENMELAEKIMGKVDMMTQIKMQANSLIGAGFDIDVSDKYPEIKDYNFGPASNLALADKITTKSRPARVAFAKGLAFMLNYNHEMAIGCFTECIKADPDCAMAHWGIAYSVSSNYNWPPGLGSGYDSIQAALKLKSKVSPLEADLIDALSKRSSKEARDGINPAALSCEGGGGQRGAGGGKGLAVAGEAATSPLLRTVYNTAGLKKPY
jgi:hypothetical protein